VPIVLVETEVGRGEGDFFDALSPHLSGALFRLPGSAALSDIAAVLAHASVFVGTSFAAGLAAHSLGAPVARLALLGGRKPVPWPPSLQRQAGALVSQPEDLAGTIVRLLAASRPEGLPLDVERRLDRHFDVLAEIAESAAGRRSSRRRRSGRPRVADALRNAERRIESWQLAYEARGEQLLHQRFRLSEALEKLEAELATSASELSTAHARKTALEAELARSAEAGRTAREALEQSHEREVEAQRTMHRLEKDLIVNLAQKAHAEEDLVSARSDLSSRTAELALERAERTRAQDALAELHERIAAVEGEKEKLVGEITSERARRAAGEREAAARLSESVAKRLRAEQKTAQAETAAAILESEVQRLEAALERLGRSEARLRISRAALLDQLEGGRAAVARGTAGLPEEVKRLRAELARVHAELSQLSNLKIFRYSAPLRAVYGRLLALRGRERKNDP
jgi:chromosome segregation ATPase